MTLKAMENARKQKEEQQKQQNSQPQDKDKTTEETMIKKISEGVSGQLAEQISALTKLTMEELDKRDERMDVFEGRLDDIEKAVKAAAGTRGTEEPDTKQEAVLTQPVKTVPPVIQPESTAPAQPVVQPEPATPVVDTPKVLLPVGYTGKRKVYFIHKGDGIDYSVPFYSALVAKWYDPEYQIAPAWFQDGKFVGTLGDPAVAATLQ